MTIFAVFIFFSSWDSYGLVQRTYLDHVLSANSSGYENGLYHDYQVGLRLNSIKNGIDFKVSELRQWLWSLHSLRSIIWVVSLLRSVQLCLNSFLAQPCLKLSRPINFTLIMMIGFTGKGYGKSKQPINAIVFTFLLSLAFVLIGTFQLKKDKKPSFVLQIQSLKYYEQFV